MNFSEHVNHYLSILNSNIKELSEASGLSYTVISRYKSGEREPGIDSEHLSRLAQGISSLAEVKNLSGMSTDSVLSVLRDALNQKNIDLDNFTGNFNLILNTLQINMKDLAATMNFDTSYLYRIRSGQRRPNDLNTFSDGFCRYIVTHYSDTASKDSISILIGCTADTLSSSDEYLASLKKWLYHASTETTTDYMQNFLQKLDEFDLNQYIRAIHFDELKVPSMPFHLPTSKNYFGIEQMKKGELDFFKATVLAKSSEPIYMCSDMPMADMAEDVDFSKKWMFAIAMSLKKGLHLNIIHNIDRPFHEMMLGLEAWIPIYMTGQISPYHLPNISTNVYHHFNYVSGTVALTGECINGFHANGKYYLTNNKEEVAYYKQKALDLFTKAQPLMEIFREYSKKQFRDFENSSANISGTRRNILSSLPLYTLSDKLLDKILSRTNLPAEKKQEIRTYVAHCAEIEERILRKNPVTDEIGELTASEFQNSPITLSLSGIFPASEIAYTFDEYKEHLELTREYAKNHSNYNVTVSPCIPFHNIQIRILEGHYVVISKEKAPTIHFVIRHPKMVSALTNFVPPVTD